MATLSSYLLEVQRLLHDANSVFWSETELTDYINEAREEVVRDTGCLRNLQISYTPLAPDGTAAVIWTQGATVATGSYIFSNIFIYEVVSGGVLGTSAPPYPSGANVFPPTTNFTDGTATLRYVANAEIIPYSALPQGDQTLDVINVTLYWGNSRIPLRYLPWSDFNAQLRYWQNYVGRPVCFSTYGQKSLYISPVPDQSYTIEVDTVMLPAPLSLATSNAVDEIKAPYTNPVQYYAAYKAKYKEQSYGEAEIFKQQYLKDVQGVLNSVYTRRIPNPYSQI